MQFYLNKSIEILSKTPQVLHSLLYGLSPDWTHTNEGEDTWSVYDVIGHLIHGEKTDWLVRTQIILSKLENKTFEPFDRFAMLNSNSAKTLDELLNEFSNLRKSNLSQLKSLNISETDFEKKATHPALGTVTLSQLLSCWAVHDLNHLSQISRVMAHQYKNEVGPWEAYLSILHKKT